MLERVEGFVNGRSDDALITDLLLWQLFFRKAIQSDVQERLLNGLDDLAVKHPEYDRDILFRLYMRVKTRLTAFEV